MLTAHTPVISQESQPHVHSALVGIWLDAGSTKDTNAASGAGHFLEHMVGPAQLLLRAQLNAGDSFVSMAVLLRYSREQRSDL